MCPAQSFRNSGCPTDIALFNASTNNVWDEVANGAMCFRADDGGARREGMRAGYRIRYQLFASNTSAVN